MGFAQRSARLSAVVVGVLVVAACSSAPGDGEATPSGGDPSYTPGPLEKLWTDAYGELDEIDFSAQQRKIDEAVAACMADQGFEWIPPDYGDPIPSEPLPADEFDPAEYAKTKGYGITTWEEEDPGVMPLPEPTGEEWVDPNQEYLDGMSEAEQQAYNEALYGTWGLEPPVEGEEMPEWDPSQAGCYGMAQEELIGSYDPMQDERFKPLLEEMNALYEQAGNDPRISEAKSAWASCMASAGYAGLSDPGMASEAIWNEYSQLLEASGESEPDPAALAELREKEIAQATADYECAQTSKVNTIQIDVQHELEQDFVDANRAELEALMAAIRESAQID